MEIKQDNLSQNQETKKKAIRAVVILAILGNTIFILGVLTKIQNIFHYGFKSGLELHWLEVALLLMYGIPFFGIFMLILPLSIIAVSSVRHRDFTKQFTFYYLAALVPTMMLWFLALYLYKLSS